MVEKKEMPVERTESPAKAPKRPKLSAGEIKYKRRREEQQRAQECKRRARDLERDNRSKLILFRSTNGYWKMGGPSALEYYHNISLRIGRKHVQLQPDRDFYHRFGDGIVSVRGLVAIDEALAKIGIKFEKEDDGVRIYDLGYTIPEEKLQMMREEQRTLTIRVNRNVATKPLNANVYSNLKRILRETYVFYRKMDQPARDFIGLRTVDAGRRMLQDYVNVSNGYAKPVETYRKILLVLMTMKTDALLMMEIKVIELRPCSRYQELLMETITLLKKDYEDAQGKR